MAACSVDFLCRDDFDAVFTIFDSYHPVANTSEVVEKIAKDKKLYHKWSLCFIVCIATTVTVSITSV